MEEDNYLQRIEEEYEEIESNPSDDFKCALLDWNIYEWQFALRGPRGTEFEGGIYHGRIKFPEEYPSKPPSVMFLTENGRFKTHRDICLSRFLNWLSSSTVRYALLKLIDLMPAYPDDELCSSEFIKEGRRDLALKSRAAATTYGSSECQKVIGQIHQYMLSKEPNGTGGGSEPSQASNGTGNVSVAYNISQITVHSTDSHHVGIFGSMNEACIRGGGTLGPVLARTPIVKEYKEIESNPSDDFKSPPVPQLPQLSPLQASNGTGGSSCYVFSENTFHATNSMGVGILDPMNVISGNTFYATNSRTVGVLDLMNLMSGKRVFANNANIVGVLAMNAFSDEGHKLLPSWLKRFSWRKQN
ncbi:hypothetical protein CerSpe_256690 [Prunus speciosa]